MHRTKELVYSIIDTDESFRKRRIKWAIQELLNTGIDPKLWRVLRKAGIRPDFYNDVGAYILNILNNE